MSGESAANSAAQRAASGASRVARAFRALPHERRLAAWAAFGLFVTLFLPWYQETVIIPGRKANLQAASVTLTGWGAFSFVEAAVLLVAAGVLTLLFQRAEGRAFHLPGGDGGVITAAGAWTCVLVIWRIFDKQGTSSNGQLATTSGIEWGIFITLVVALFLTYAGSRIRAAHRPEPPLPGEAPPDAAAPAAPTERTPESPRRRRPASLSAPEAPKPAPYGRAGAKAAASEASGPPTLPKRPRPDQDDQPTLPQRPEPGPVGEPTLPQRPNPARDDEPTLPNRPRRDPHDDPTLPSRRPGSLWQPASDEHRTIPLDRRDED